jgi:hypothetical protein
MGGAVDGAALFGEEDRIAEWSEVFGDPVVATALLDRLPNALSSVPT